ncbi:unnamed protein product [Mucor fragilis]
MVKIAYEGLKLTRNLTMATTNRGALTTLVSKEVSTAVLSVVGSVAPNTETMFSALVTKKPEIEADVVAPIVIKGHFANVSNGFAALDPRLVDITPAEDAATINEYVNRISSAYTLFKNAFGIA